MTVGKNSQSLRQENLRLLLQNILSSEDALSRATLAKQVGLARPTVSRLVDELVDLGIVSELAPVRNTVGRPAAPLVARAGVRCSVGVEVNLNYLAVVVLDLAGAELFKVCDSFTSRTASPKQVIARAFTLLRDFLPPAGMQVVSIWLAVPGLVTPDRKTVVTSPNLGWENVTPSDFAEEGPTGLAAGISPANLVLANEADASAYTYIYSAPGRLNPDATFLYLSAEVGIGAAIVRGGKIFGGQHGWAGEIGHTCVDSAGPACRCGSNGCLEQYAGLEAMARRAGLKEDASIDQLLTAAEQGDTKAEHALCECARALGIAVANVLNLLDLDLVILGGHLAALHDQISNMFLAELRHRVLSSRWASISVSPSKYGRFTAARGAALAGMEAFVHNPEVW